MFRPWRVRGALLAPADGESRPLVVGIVNVTPDSFHDGGLFVSLEKALAQALRLRDEGADLIDVGGESTRPGAASVPVDEEISRVVPLIAQLRAHNIPTSIDTRRPAVAHAALEAGALAINDVSGLRDARMIELCQQYGAGACAMHMQGEPGTMQVAPHYDDVVQEVASELASVATRWREAGLPADALTLDPGIGFGKTPAHNLALLQGTHSLRARFPEHAWYLGLSRKSFVARHPGTLPNSDRLAGTLGATLAAIAQGADIVRVHDVAATLEAWRLFRDVRGTP